LKIKKLGRNSNSLNSKNKSSKVRKVKKKNWVFFFCFFCEKHTSYKFLTRESPEKMKFLTSKKTNFCHVLGLTEKKSHLFCAILGYDTSESLTSRFLSLF